MLTFGTEGDYGPNVWKSRGLSKKNTLRDNFDE